ncbi:MAG: tRNA glutamyl-Q(34) synthetase GluQRS [Verrucomicrobiota bacterium]
MITRFAPSPTGRLHLGHAYSAVLSWNAAQAAGGTWLLRIEDIDVTRCRAEWVDGILEDLAWLGFTWDEPVLFQSDRLPQYQSALEDLMSKGLVYPCFCSRRDVEETASPGPLGPIYSGTCRHLTERDRKQREADGLPFSLRLHLHEAENQHALETLTWLSGDEGPIPVSLAPHGDVILARKDIHTSYHLAVTLDDDFQNVTDVVRGADLKDSTSVHRLLQELLKLSSPCYWHHDLILDERGRKFSKRDRAPTLQSIREAGGTPAYVFQRLGILPVT